MRNLYFTPLPLSGIDRCHLNLFADTKPIKSFAPKTTEDILECHLGP